MKILVLKLCNFWLCTQLQADDVVLRCNALDALNDCALSCEGDLSLLPFWPPQPYDLVCFMSLTFFTLSMRWLEICKSTICEFDFALDSIEITATL